MEIVPFLGGKSRVLKVYKNFLPFTLFTFKLHSLWRLLSIQQVAEDEKELLQNEEENSSGKKKKKFLGSIKYKVSFHKITFASDLLDIIPP